MACVCGGIWLVCVVEHGLCVGGGTWLVWVVEHGLCVW